MVLPKKGPSEWTKAMFHPPALIRGSLLQGKTLSFFVTENQWVFWPLNTCQWQKKEKTSPLAALAPALWLLLCLPHCWIVNWNHSREGTGHVWGGSSTAQVAVPPSYTFRLHCHKCIGLEPAHHKSHWQFLWFQWLAGFVPSVKEPTSAKKIMDLF